MRHLRTLSIAFILGFASAISAPAAETVTIDWSFLGTGTKVSGIYGSKGAPVSILNVVEGGVVAKDGDPPNPFPGVEQALYVQKSPSTNVVRIRTRPFPEQTPPKGSFEFQFRLVSGAIAFGWGRAATPWDPEIHQSYHLDSILGEITFTVGEPLEIKGKMDYSTASLKSLEAGQNYTFKVEWNESGEASQYQFFLNNEEVIDAKGARYVFSAPRKEEDHGVLAFIIQSGGPDIPNEPFFLGKMQATSE